MNIQISLYAQYQLLKKYTDLCDQTLFYFLLCLVSSNKGEGALRVNGVRKLELDDHITIFLEDVKVFLRN